MNCKIKVERPHANEARITCQFADGRQQVTLLDSAPVNANAITDSYVAAGKLGVWFGPLA